MMRCLNIIASLLLVLSSGCSTPYWYKGATHLHTLWSDGDQLPELAVNWYLTNGYNFVAISDHNTLLKGEKWKNVSRIDTKYGVLDESRRLFGKDYVQTRQEKGKAQVRLKTIEELRTTFSSAKDFILLDNQEITAKSGGKYAGNVHMNALNLHENVAVHSGGDADACALENIRRARELAVKEGSVIHCHLNHPNWLHSHPAEDLARIVSMDSFELYNGGGFCNNLGDEYSVSTERAWDIATVIRLTHMKISPFFAVATDDTHNYHEIDPRSCMPGRGWIMVRSKKLDADSIIRAMNKGDFYASTGVELENLDYDAARRVLSVSVVPRQGVEYSIEFIGTSKGCVAEPNVVYSKDRSNKPIRMTGSYSPDIGRVLKKVQGSAAEYKLSGTELYVRAAVRSSVPVPDSAETNNYQSAWTQPYGWEKLPDIAKK